VLIVMAGRSARWVGPMLNKLTVEIAECYRDAEECAQRAQREPDPGLRADFLDMERRWLALARSYEFTQQLRRFQ
jgi:hypothetical protein